MSGVHGDFQSIRDAVASFPVRERDEFLNRLAGLLLEYPIDLDEALQMLHRNQAGLKVWRATTDKRAVTPAHISAAL